MVAWSVTVRPTITGTQSDMTPTDGLLRRLHHLGWSIGDVAFRDPATGRTLCLATGTRGKHVILAQEQTQSEAWREARWLAGSIEREG